jgi:RNA polymerase sigma-70 factor (ECF subfamily)
METTDFDLCLDFLKSQDSRTFRELVNRHSRLVYHIAFRVTGNHHEAEDVTQDVFVVILKKLKKYDQKRSFRAWAAGIAVKTALKAVRRREREARRHWRKAAMSAQENTSEPADEAERREIAMLVEQGLEDLPSESKIPIVLHHLEGLTCAETGQAMGIPEGTVKSRITRGLERIRTGISAGKPSFTAIGLIPFLTQIPVPVPPPGLVETLYALPVNLAVSGGIAAKTAALVKGSILMKIHVWGLVLLILAVTISVAGVLALQDESGLFISSPESVVAPGSGIGEEHSLPSNLSGKDLQPPKPSSDSASSIASGASDTAPGVGNPSQENQGEGIAGGKAAEKAGVVSTHEVRKPIVRKISMADWKKMGGGIRIGGAGGRRFGPAGRSKWAPRPSKKGNCTLSGRILDSRGAPVWEADVYRSKDGTECGEGRIVSFGKLIRFAKTDKNGSFTGELLPAGEYFIAANYKNSLNTDRGLDTAGAVKISLVDAEKKSGITIRISIDLSALGGIEGKIVDEAGNPVVGAEIFAGFCRAFSDANGAYRFTALPAGPATVSVGKTGYLKGETSVEVPGGGTLRGINVVMRLKEKGENSVFGVVTDGFGRPVEGASVLLLGERRTLRSGKTDAAGSFRFEDVAQREAKIQVWKPGYKTALKPIKLPFGNMSILLEKDVVISGFVKSAATGEALDLFNLKMYREGADGKKVHLGAQSNYSKDGSFKVQCSPGKLILEVEAPEHEKAVFEIEVPHGMDEVTDVLLELEKSPEQKK